MTSAARVRRRLGASPGGRPPGRRSLGFVVAGALVIVGLPAGIIGFNLAAPPAASPSASAVAAGSASPGIPANPTPSLASPSASSAPTTPPAATPSPTGPARTAQAIVPVTNFRTIRVRAGWADLQAIAARDPKARFDSLGLVAADADAILATLELDASALGDRLVLAATPADLAVHLREHPSRLAFLRASEVGPNVRAIAWGRASLFGTDRVATLADWPLTAILATPARTYDPAAAWTLVAGGDILLDRGVSLAIREHDGDPDFPFDGGTVEITGRCKDCSAFGWDLPYTERTGNDGAVRELLAGADLAIANFENPAPDEFRFHSRGTVFSANPAHIEGLADAGIDWVSLANNHIGDAGRTGILETIENLADHGIESSGAGRNRIEARRPKLLEVDGTTVAILAYDTIARSYAADPDTPGSAIMTALAVEADVARAREAGADVVIVFPHWGTEYDATPSASQRDLAHVAIDAGADMIIGNHAHWAAAMEVYKGKPIWYALGNFVFDQTWSEPTMEGLLLELTFVGERLVQAELHPHLILDRAQPNFLDAAADGRVVTNQVWDASDGLLPW